MLVLDILKTYHYCMFEVKKISAMCIYFILSVNMGLARWYVNKNSSEVPSYVRLYAHGACIFPYLLYKINFKSKWFLFVFVQLFSLLYVHIFEGTNTAHFFTSLVDFSDILLRYNLYWKYIVYNTLTLENAKSFHLYASTSYVAYHMDEQINKFIPESLNTVYLLYTCSGLYLCIGVLVFFMYTVDEKHILMYDKISVKRALLKSVIIYSSMCNLLNTLTKFESDYTDYSTIIASCVILTVDGKLLQYFDYTMLNHVSAIVTFISYITMTYINNYESIIVSICLQLLIGTKFIVFDSVHQILHITHKKNVIDKYIGIEIIAMSTAYLTIYFLPQSISLYFMIVCTLVQLMCEHFIIKYYKKDVEFLNCVAQLCAF